MGSIQIDSDMTGETSSLLRSTEGFERCLTGVNLLRSSWEAVVSFAKASAHKFFALGMCLNLTSTNFLINLCTFFKIYDHFFALGLVGVFYLLYYQLGVATHL